MNICVVGSGSRGNAIALWCGDSGLLVDVGLSYKRMAEALPDPSIFRSALISHHHGDHRQSVRKWIETHGTQVYATHATAAEMAVPPRPRDPENPRKSPIPVNPLEMYPAAFHPIPLRKMFETEGGWKVVAVPVEHQAAGAVTFMILSPDGVKVSMFLETGRITREMFKFGRNGHVYVVECNHDEGMLATNEQRPDYVNDRAAHGHLSNDQAMTVIEHLDPTVQHVFLIHLSEQCNDPALVKDISDEALGKRLERGRPPLEIHISDQDVATKIVEVRK